MNINQQRQTMGIHEANLPNPNLKVRLLINLYVSEGDPSLQVYC